MVHQVMLDLAKVLKSSAVAELRTLELECSGEQIILRGVVGSYYYKQLAQELVRNSAAGFEIDNAISVEYHNSAEVPDWQHTNLS